MRIGIFSCPASRGGVQVFSDSLARLLRTDGHEVVLFVPHPESDGDRERLDEMAPCYDRVIALGRSDDSSEPSRELAVRIEDETLDVFLPNFRRTTYAACAAMPTTKRPRIIAVCHDNSAAYYGMLFLYQDIVDRFVCPTIRTHEILKSLLDGRGTDVLHIPHSLDWPDVGPPPMPDGEIGLLYHGRLDEGQKDVTQVIRLGAVLQGRGVPFRLTLVGGGAAESRCRELVAELDLGERVAFHEPCGRRELERHFLSHHLSVLTSRHEGFCLGLAEAMRAGLPGLAFACGGVIEEYLCDGVNGFVVPPGDLETMADRVAHLVDRPNRWAEFSRRARSEICRSYAPAPVLERYRALLSGLATGPARGRWPRLRPVDPSEAHDPWHALIEKLGTRLAGWPDARSITSRLDEMGVRY